MSPETCVPYRPNDFASAFTPVKPRHKTAVREGPPSPESAFSTPTRPNLKKTGGPISPAGSALKISPISLPSPARIDTNAERSTVEREEELEFIKDALEKLQSHIYQRSAEYRRENTDYFEGDTPRTSQGSNQSEYRYSQRSAADIVTAENMVDFMLQHLGTDEVYSVISPFMGMSLQECKDNRLLFRECITMVLNADPRLFHHLVSSALQMAERDAEETRLRAVFDLP